MAIKVTRNAAGNCVNFLGSSNPAYWNACLSAEADSQVSGTVNVINDIRTAVEGVTQYEFFQVPFDTFQRADGTSFTSATECAEYITAEANVASNTGQFILAANDSLDFTLDSTGTTVLVDNGDAYAVNAIRAVGNEEGHIDILQHTGDVTIFSDLRVANTSISGVAVSATLATAVNELNSLFQQTGGASGSAPVITSAATINLTEGDTLNYELIATDGVGYEWDLSNVPGVVTVEGNMRKLIGGSSLAAGTYSIPAKAINYFGETALALSLVVSAPPFSNTKSVNFQNQDYLGGNANALDPILGRTGNGSGSSDAWTISLWFKPSTSNNGQTIFYFGDNDATNGGHIQLMQANASGGKFFRLRFGSSQNRLQLQTAPGTLVPGTWHHLMVSYDGGSTGSSSSNMSQYYGRFSLFIDGVSVSTTNSHINYGYTASIDPDNFRVGRFVSGTYMRDNARVDELAIWGSDQSANIADIYNSGSPFDLTSLTTSPNHWWRMGDGDTYSTILDNIGNVHFVMYNMTAADIVTDAP